MKKKHVRQRIRPKGAPAEILYLKDGSKVGAFGLRVVNRQVEYLLLNPTRYISKSEVQKVVPYSIEEENSIYL